MNVEYDLQRALRRKPAPRDLVDRVTARLGQRDTSPDRSVSPSRRWPAVRWLATAAAIAFVAMSGAGYYARQRKAVEAERAQNDVRLALQIAGEKLALVQRKLQEPHK